MSEGAKFTLPTFTKWQKMTLRRGCVNPAISPSFTTAGLMKTWQVYQFSADVYCKIMQALLQIFFKNPTKLNKQGKLLNHNSADTQVHRNLKMDTS